MLIHLFLDDIVSGGPTSITKRQREDAGPHEIASFELKQLFPNVTEKRDFPPGSPVQA
jgi:hypothetical protein